LFTVPCVLVCQSIGHLTHVFSHLKHEMSLHHIRLKDSPPLAAASLQSGRPVELMDAARMAECGVTTGVKRILAALEAYKAKGEKKQAGKKRTKKK
jgi:hypothetical protein